MGLLQRFENRLEQVVSGAFAKAFRSAVQPVEIAAALQREVDNSAQILSRERRLVPNSFTVELSTTDYARLGPYEHTLGAELADMLHEHADEQHYVFTGPVAIAFEQADDLGTGRFRVRSQAAAQVSTPYPPRPRAPAQKAQDGEEAPVRRTPQVVVEVNGTRHPLGTGSMVVGRGAESDLRINDPGISRRHAELRLLAAGDPPRVEVVDLGSTNGTLVNGHRVTQAAVTDATTIKLGNTTLTVHFVDPGGGDDV